MNEYIYKKDNVGIKLLSEEELKGEYPSWFYDEAVNQYNSHWARPKSKNEIFKFVSELDQDKSMLVFAIYCVEYNKHIGNISLQNIDHYNQCAEIAFLFGNKSYWGKGYATIASKIVIDHAFKNLNMNRVYLGCLKNNLAMIKLASKIGFKKEGVRRSALFSAGEFIDVWEYGLLKHER